MHPLSKSLSDLSDTELTDKIFDLERRLNVSYRLGSYNLIRQLEMVLEDYKIEHQKRAQKQLEEMIKTSGKNFKDIINIE